MVDFKKIIEGRIRFSKYFMLFIFILFLFVTGSTYAYYAFQEEDSVVIKGNIISIDADLDVKLVVGTNEKMVPMQDAALANALKGTGSTNGACIDNVGNLSCQVYQITLTNNGSKLKNLEGSIELYPKEGTGNAYSNLKWRELENPTTIKENSIVNGMSKSLLVSDLTLESKQEKVWYIVVWLSEADYDQYDIDKGLFEGMVTFESIEDNEKVVECITDGVTTQYENLSSALDEASTTSDTTCTLYEDLTENVTNTKSLYNTTINLNNKTLTGYIDNNNTNSKITIKDGNISSFSSLHVVRNVGIMDILNGTYLNASSRENSYVIYNTGTLTISDGIFNLENSSNGSAIYNGGIVNMNAGTISSSKYGIGNGGGSFNAHNLNITASYGVYNDFNGSVNLFDSFITGNGVANNKGTVVSFDSGWTGTLIGVVHIFRHNSDAEVQILVYNQTITSCPTWTSDGAQDDLKWYAATAVEGTFGNTYYTCTIPYSNHNSTTSIYNTDFYNEDICINGFTWKWNFDH